MIAASLAFTSTVASANVVATDDGVAEEQQAPRRIEGRVGDARIPQGQISFDLYKGSQFEPGDKRAIATAIIIEEVARACATSSLIPAVNKLGTVPLLLAGSAELKQRYLPPVARGEAMFSYALSEPEAGSDAAAMSTRAVRNGENYILNGTKRWITNAGVSRFYTVMAVTDPSAGASGISARLSGGATGTASTVRAAPERDSALSAARAVPPVAMPSSTSTTLRPSMFSGGRSRRSRALRAWITSSWRRSSSCR